MQLASQCNARRVILISLKQGQDFDSLQVGLQQGFIERSLRVYGEHTACLHVWYTKTLLFSKHHGERTHVLQTFSKVLVCRPSLGRR